MATMTTTRPGQLTRRPSMPTSVLPQMPKSLVGNQSESLSSTKLSSLIAHLQLLYANAPHDSGYSSEVDSDDVDDLGSQDSFERGWTRNWLEQLLKRSDEWINEAEEQSNSTEKEARMQVIEDAARLVAHLSATSESDSILRPLLLPTCAHDAKSQTEPLSITLNDALPSSLDPTSVGLQSWGASIILARMFALYPQQFGIGVPGRRTLELGAGTGLLSLVWKGMSERLGTVGDDVIATDYHPTVLQNLRKNVEANKIAISPLSSPFQSPKISAVDAAKISPLSAAHSNEQPPVIAHKLDWQAVHSSRMFATTSTSPLTMPAPFDKPFHTLLAADCVYGPDHALWLKSCVEQFLIKPDAHQQQRANTTLPPLHLDTPETATQSNKLISPAPTFHLIVPIRPTHGPAIESIGQVFPLAQDLPALDSNDPTWRVAIKKMTELPRVKGVGRADETCYRLYEIGWCR